jgi:hypothetical protein
LNKQVGIAAVLVSIFAGIIFFLVERGIVFINLPKSFFSKQSIGQMYVSGSKKVTYFYYKHSVEESVNEEIVWSSLSKTDQYKMLVAGWVQHGKDDGLLDQALWIDSVVLSGLENELYLSFSRSFLREDMSIAARWSLVEGLLKTCKQGSCSLEKVYFLVNHQPMLDYQLDFSGPISINGFMH